MILINAKDASNAYLNNKFNEEEKYFIFKEIESILEEINSKCKDINYITRFYGNQEDIIISFIAFRLQRFFGYNIRYGVHKEIIISWA